MAAVALLAVSLFACVAIASAAEVPQRMDHHG